MFDFIFLLLHVTVALSCVLQEFFSLSFSLDIAVGQKLKISIE